MTTAVANIFPHESDSSTICSILKVYHYNCTQQQVHLINSFKVVFILVLLH